MTSSVRTNTATGTGIPNVIPFPGQRSDEPSSGLIRGESLSNELIRLGRQDESLAASIIDGLSGYLLGYISRIEATKTGYQDDPFGPIYLSQLRPDVLAEGHVNELQLFSRVVDFSDRIEFRDEWED